MYSQNEEEKYILDYFKDFKGNLLDIGANDGRTFSNSLALIERGWWAVLVEPSAQAFERLHGTHVDNDNVYCFKGAITEDSGKFTLKVSADHLLDKSDVALLSSIKEEETIRWREAGIKFHEETINGLSYLDFLKYTGESNFDFITIDAEGFDIIILKQIDLTETKLLCIEWNSNPINKLEILEYCANFGMTKIIYESGENLLLCKQVN